MTDHTDRLAAANLRKTYDGVVALDGVTMTFEPGVVHCVAGPNGSGKSTFFRLLLGLTRPTDGSVTRPDATIGAGFQSPAFYPSLTVGENLTTFGAIAEPPDDEWQQRLVEVLGLDRVSHRKASALSGGFAKKLDLALALLKQPRFLLLDEPLADLDDISEAKFLAFLDAYSSDGNAVVVTTHRIEEFSAVLDRLTVVYDGTIALDTDRADLDLAGHASLESYYVSLLEELDQSPGVSQ